MIRFLSRRSIRKLVRENHKQITKESLEQLEILFLAGLRKVIRISNQFTRITKSEVDFVFAPLLK